MSLALTRYDKMKKCSQFSLRQRQSRAVPVVVKKNKKMEAEEMKSPFEAIKQTDEAGREWWNSRQLAKVMGYTKYWNFERLIDKVAHALQVERGLGRDEHFREIEEMAQLGNGTARRVTSVLLSRAACMGIACNADQRKPLVKMAREYFQGALTGKELAKGMEGNVLIYRSSTGKVNVSVLFNQETFWLSQQRMAELFGVTCADISYHLIQIENNGELHLSDCIKKILIPSEQWEEQGVTLYNLDAVIAVGYRVNSYEATQFRIWATQVLKEFIVKGFVLDNERLKGKTVFGEDYRHLCRVQLRLRQEQRDYTPFIQDRAEYDALCCHPSDSGRNCI